MVAATLNEIRIMRSDNAAMNGQKLEAVLVKSPRQAEQAERDREEKEQIRQAILLQLHGGQRKELTTK